MSAPTFIENMEHANAVAFQHSEGAKEQLQSGNTGLGAQVALPDDHPHKMSELLDRKVPKCSNKCSLSMYVHCIGDKARATKFGNPTPSSSPESARIICSSAEKPRSFCIWWCGGR